MMVGMIMDWIKLKKQFWLQVWCNDNYNIHTLQYIIDMIILITNEIRCVDGYKYYLYIKVCVCCTHYPYYLHYPHYQHYFFFVFFLFFHFHFIKKNKSIKKNEFLFYQFQHNKNSTNMQKLISKRYISELVVLEPLMVSFSDACMDIF